MAVELISVVTFGPVEEAIKPVSETGSEDEVLVTLPVVLEAIDAVTEVVGFVAEPVEDGMLPLAPVPEASPITPHADGLSQLDAISCTDETAARLSVIEGSIAMSAKVTWLRVHPEAQLDTDEDAELLEDTDDLLMAVLEAVRGFELDGFELVVVAL